MGRVGRRGRGNSMSRAVTTYSTCLIRQIKGKVLSENVIVKTSSLWLKSKDF